MFVNTHLFSSRASRRACKKKPARVQKKRRKRKERWDRRNIQHSTNTYYTSSRVPVKDKWRGGGNIHSTEASSALASIAASARARALVPRVPYSTKNESGDINRCCFTGSGLRTPCVRRYCSSSEPWNRSVLDARVDDDKAFSSISLSGLGGNISYVD